MGERVRGFRWFFAAILMAAPAAAEPLSPDEVPEPLRPWVEWVLRGHEQERCPFLHGSPAGRTCVWPSRLELDLGDQSGTFSQHWRVYDEVLVSLPGGEKRWPQGLTVDGQPAPVIAVDGKPSVRLRPGSHTASGRFRWDALPELIQIPPETGLVSLRLRGQHVAFPNRDVQGRLWLQKRAQAESGEESRLEVEVHRRVADEIPLQLTTRIELQVSGRGRELVLGRALPDGFLPMALSSTVPARLDPDGRLRVQVRPGTWYLTLEARHEGPVESLSLPEPGGPWDPSEVWVFDARPHLRLVTVENGVAVDPAQTALPREWRHLPAYLMETGRRITLVEKRRGDEDPAPDDLQLARTWWLDFDGEGYTVTDQIEGVIRRSTRLEMGPSTQLGRVAIGGRDQFITRLGGFEALGIEVPQGALRISADSRVDDGARRIAAVGWDHDFRSLRGQLNLPPGWVLIHAAGADRASPSWISRWTLLDLFAVLVIAMVFFRLFGPRWGALALVTLALSYTEPAAPRWIWIAVLVAEALRRVLPAGRLADATKLYHAGALAVLVLATLPFMVSEIRGGMYPALERRGRPPMSYPEEEARTDLTGGQETALAQEGMLARREADALRMPAASEPAVKRSISVGRLAKRYQYAPDPKARITTGPGLPTWEWHRVALHWSGPVERGQTLGLLLLPPWLNGILAFVRVALLAALVLCVLRGFRPASGSRPRGASAAALAAWLLFALAAGAPAPARADIPSPELLGELRTRLLERPECHPHCASSPQLRLEVSPRTLRARIEVDVVAATAVPLPGGARNWSPQTVLLDGAPAPGLRRDGDGRLWLELSPGRHQVLVEGPLPDRDSVELPLPLRPHRVEARAIGWVVHGLHEDGQAEPNLQLARIREETARRDDALEPGELPPFVRLQRALHLGLSWQIVTTLERMTPADAAIVLDVPLLAGESVTSAAIRVDDGRALVSLGPGVTSTSWTSVLDERADLVLRAPDAVPWTEVWWLDVSPVWHVDAEGIPTVHQPSPEGARVREWRPWPGEEVRLRVSRPEGVEGATATIDASQLDVKPGLRATDSTLALTLRSSRGGQHTLVLPEDAELQSVEVGGAVQPIRQEGREVSLQLMPGSQQVELAWREPRGVATHFRFRTPEVDLGMPSVNGRVRVVMSPGRWTLFAGGPRLGPAVLFWPLVAVLAFVGLALSRIPLTPLRFHDWLLLALGLTQGPILVAALVAGWLLALGWRRQHGTEVPGRWFSLLQIALAGGTALALAGLFFSIERGLLGLPEMQIAGNGSTSELLHWYQDRVGDTLARPWAFTVPLFVYRLAMLAWALWLAQALVRWLRWGWSCFSEGEIWRPLRARRVQPGPASGS